MPSPVGHILGGAALYLTGANGKERSNTALAATLFGSIVPDFDFLPGILMGDPGAFHHGVSHSWTFAILFGALVWLCVWRFDEKVALRAAVLGVVAYAFHVVFDAVTVSGSGRGLPIFWPVSDARFGADLGLFGHFHHDRLEEGLWSVVRWDNLPALTRELTVLGIPVLLLFFWRARRDRSNVARTLIHEDEYER